MAKALGSLANTVTSGFTMVDHRRRGGEEENERPADQMGATMPRGDEGPQYTQQQLMDMVAKRFPRAGKGRFLVVNDFAKRKHGSLYIPENAQRPTTSGRVCVANDCEGIKVGDHVVYALFSGTSLPLAKDARVLAMKEEEVMCWIDDNAPDSLKLEGEVL